MLAGVVVRMNDKEKIAKTQADDDEYECINCGQIGGTHICKPNPELAKTKGEDNGKI